MSAHLTLLSEVLPVTAPFHIVDVGANPTEAPNYQPIAETGLARVTGFEPNPDAFKKLKKNAPAYAKYLNNAIGTPGDAVFNSYKSSEMSSLFKICAKATGYLGQFRRHIGTEDEIPVTLSALDDIVDVAAIDLLKIDAQGAECDIIDGAQEKLENAVAVIVETRFYRIYENEPLLGDVDTRMRKLGFELHKFVYQKTRMLPNSQRTKLNRRLVPSQLIDGDAIFVRNMETKADWSTEQFCYLTLMASLVFESHDMALMCLDELVRRGVVAKGTPAKYVAALPRRLRAD